MRAQLLDLQDNDSAWNGRVLESPQDLRARLAEAQLQPRAPFFAQLVGDHGHQLLLGVGALEGCAQLSSTDGEPPYLMAVGPDPSDGERVFLTGGTPTPVPRRYGLPMPVVIDIACFFMQTGERLPSVAWEEIGPA